ncbi:MAG: CHRD domain-containing protein [Actinomycetota bacterium]
MSRVRSLGRALPVVAGAATLALGAGVAAAGTGTHAVTGKLTAAQEVPKPTGVARTAGGSFTATLRRGTRTTLTWKLTFTGLSGRALQAHVHLGRRGVAGPVAIALCGPCRSGATGTARITRQVADAIENGRAYVNVHTARNAAGEIRGQLAVKVR